MWMRFLGAALLAFGSFSALAGELTANEMNKLYASLASFQPATRDAAIKELSRTYLDDAALLMLLKIADKGLVPSPKMDDFMIVDKGCGCQPWAQNRIMSTVVKLGWKQATAQSWREYQQNSYGSAYGGYGFYYGGFGSGSGGYSTAGGYAQSGDGAAETLEIAKKDSSKSTASWPLIWHYRDNSKVAAKLVLESRPLDLERVGELHLRKMHTTSRTDELEILKAIYSNENLESYAARKLQPVIEESQKILDEAQAEHDKLFQSLDSHIHNKEAKQEPTPQK